MTTFHRFCEYVDASHKMQSKVPRGASYHQVVEALADAGFEGATAGELRTLERHMRGLTETRREQTVLLKETIDLMEKRGIRAAEVRAGAISEVVPADDIRGRTVRHDLRQFEADVKEAARRLGRSVPSIRIFDANVTADNVFAWVYALNNGMLPPTHP